MVNHAGPLSFPSPVEITGLACRVQTAILSVSSKNEHLWASRLRIPLSRSILNSRETIVRMGSLQRRITLRFGFIARKSYEIQSTFYEFLKKQHSDPLQNLMPRGCENSFARALDTGRIRGAAIAKFRL
jgi:hypothetical protein